MAHETSTVMEPARRLVVIGGAEDRSGECVILRAFLRRATPVGGDAHIVVIPIASDSPKRTGGDYVETFRRLGAGASEVLHLQSREEARAPRSIEMLERATGVFLTGGDQQRIMSMLGGTKLDTLLHHRWEQGMVLAGTSAGATAMSSTMLMEHSPEADPLEGPVWTGPGMEFLQGAVIDQHFGERKRLGRLLSVVARFPHELGIGIDEDTGLLVDDHTFEVIGHGTVTVIDGGSAAFYDRPGRGTAHVRPAFCDIRLHVLPAGHRFDLVERRPIVEAVRIQVED
jgi:cyanophycinase